MRSRFRASFSDSPVTATEGERIQGAFYAVFSLGTAALVVQGILAGQPYTAVGAGAFGVAILLSWGLGKRGHLVASRLLLPVVPEPQASQ